MIITGLAGSDAKYINIGNELKNIDDDNFQSKLQQFGRGNTKDREPKNKNRTRDTNERKKTDQLLNIDQSAKSQAFKIIKALK